MCVLEGGGGAAAEGEEQLVERSAEQAKLGVNLLLFAGSRWSTHPQFSFLLTWVTWWLISVGPGGSSLEMLLASVASASFRRVQA